MLAVFELAFLVRGQRATQSQCRGFTDGALNLWRV
jgi:hypothetical protein